jgi:hypothetical protein
MTNEQMVEAMIEKFLEHANLPWDPETQPHLDRDYVLGFREPAVIGADDATRIVYTECHVDDELISFQLIGVFDEEELIHLTSEVDTSWREVGYSEFPSGLITEDNPWKRTWKFTTTP